MCAHEDEETPGLLLQAAGLPRPLQTSTKTLLQKVKVEVLESRNTLLQVKVLHSKGYSNKSRTSIGIKDIVKVVILQIGPILNNIICFHFN